MSKRIIMGLALLATGAPALADVKSSTPAGFEIRASANVAATPAEAYAMLGRIGDWWNPSHSYSGKAENLRLGLKAGDCFCESLGDGGTVEHMRVVQARPGRLLRLQGGLGPLQAEGVSGTLTWELKQVAGGTEVTQTYVVGGYIRAGAERFAGAVDKVMTEQFQRFAARFPGRGTSPAK